MREPAGGRALTLAGKEKAPPAQAPASRPAPQPLCTWMARLQPAELCWVLDAGMPSIDAQGMPAGAIWTAACATWFYGLSRSLSLELNTPFGALRCWRQPRGTLTCVEELRRAGAARGPRLLPALAARTKKTGWGGVGPKKSAPCPRPAADVSFDQTCAEAYPLLRAGCSVRAQPAGRASLRQSAASPLARLQLPPSLLGSCRCFCTLPTSVAPAPALPQQPFSSLPHFFSLQGAVPHNPFARGAASPACGTLLSAVTNALEQTVAGLPAVGQAVGWSALLKGATPFSGRLVYSTTCRKTRARAKVRCAALGCTVLGRVATQLGGPGHW